MTIWPKGKKISPWATPAGYFTTFAVRGDPVLDKPGAREALYARLFATADGRAVLADMLALAGAGRSDYEPGLSRDDAIFNSGMKASAFNVARLAGLDLGALGRGLVNGNLEEMIDA